MLPQAVAFFGASSVYGAGDVSGGGFVTRFRRWYDEVREKSVIYNLGIPGETTKSLAERFEPEKNRRHPQLIIFQLGANDAHRQGGQQNPPVVPLSKFESNLKFLFTEGFKTAAVGVVSPYPVNETKNPHSRPQGPQDSYYLNADIADYATALKQTAAEFKIPYLNLWSDWLQDEKYLKFLHTDGLHANSDGHAEIARRLTEFVQTHFSAFQQPL